MSKESIHPTLKTKTKNHDGLTRPAFRKTAPVAFRRGVVLVVVPLTAAVHELAAGPRDGVEVEHGEGSATHPGVGGLGTPL